MNPLTSTLLASGGGAATFPVSTALIAIPVIGALVIALTPQSRPESHRLTAILTSLLAGAVSLWVLASFDPEATGFQFVQSTTWVAAYDIKFFVGIDGISLFLVVLTGIIFPIALFAAKPDHDEKGYYAWLSLLQAGCFGVFLALDLFLFFLMFELTLVPLYFLIGKWGHGRRVYAATKFFLFTMLGSAFMLVCIVALAYLAEAGPGGGISFDLQKVAASDAIDRDTLRWLFLGFAVAFMVKTPVFPLHTWLPDAHTEAPTAASVGLAGILLKLGTYGFLRYGLYLFPEASVWAAPALITLGTIGIIYGGIVAAMQKNLKRLVAYSSVAHMGFCVIGLFALNVEGIEGSILQMVNHGLITGGLFIMLGFLYQRRHTYEIAELGGLQKVAPVFAGVFTVVMLASIGVPGLAGFVGEFLALLGTFMAHRWWGVVAATGVILAALYLLWAYQRAFHGEPEDANRSFPELRLSEKLVMAPLVGLIVFLGVYPQPVLERIEPAVEQLVGHLEREVPGFTSASTRAGGDLDAEAIATAAEEAEEGEGHSDGGGSGAGAGEEAE